jgi:hypothetical protein
METELSALPWPTGPARRVSDGRDWKDTCPPVGESAHMCPPTGAPIAVPEKKHPWAHGAPKHPGPTLQGVWMKGNGPSPTQTWARSGLGAREAQWAVLFLVFPPLLPHPRCWARLQIHNPLETPGHLKLHSTPGNCLPSGQDPQAVRQGKRYLPCSLSFQHTWVVAGAQAQKGREMVWVTHCEDSRAGQNIGSAGWRSSKINPVPHPHLNSSLQAQPPLPWSQRATVLLEHSVSPSHVPKAKPLGKVTLRGTQPRAKSESLDPVHLGGLDHHWQVPSSTACPCRGLEAEQS